MSDTVRVTVEGGRGRLTLNRPPLNVLTIEMLRELAHGFERLAGTADVRLVRLDAEGKAFSAGVDVADHIGDKIPAMIEALEALFDAMERVAVPTVSVVQGAALGGGCELTLGTDLCVASEKASFGQPEIRLGLFAPPASVLMPRLLGERRALGLLLTGETIRAAEAERVGLVNRVFPAESFESDVAQWQDQLLELSGAALRQAKRAVLAARGRAPAEAHRELGRIYLEDLMRTADATEGLAAFMEKRKPVWKHC